MVNDSDPGALKEGKREDEGQVSGKREFIPHTSTKRKHYKGEDGKGKRTPSHHEDRVKTG